MRRSRPIPSATRTTSAPVGLADVGDLVDERDARHQGGVGGELDHLGRRDVAPDDGAVDAGVQRGDRVPVLLAERSHDDPVGVQEVGDGGALGGELRIRRVSDLLEAALVEAVAHPEAGSDRHGALHHDDAVPVDRRQLVDHRPDRGEIGVAGVGRRRADRDVDELGAVDRLGDVQGEADPVGVPRDQLGQSGLVDRHLAALEGRDPIGEHVANDDRVAEVGEAGPRDEADVPGAENRDA